MDRSRRASDTESELWSNPCDYNKESLENSYKYSPEMAHKVSVQARDTVQKAQRYQQQIATLQSFSKFEDLMNLWSATEWLRNFDWFKNAGDKVLPQNKVYGKPVDDEYIDSLLNTKDIEELLPVFGKTLKMLGASLKEVSKKIRQPQDPSVNVNLMNMSDNVRYVLCEISAIARSKKNVEMLPLYDSEIPVYVTQSDAVKATVLIYRDTINFLEYIEQFFYRMETLKTA